jgi:SAM-dependent methyltransferase
VTALTHDEQTIDALGVLGGRLRKAGLVPRALEAWAGTARLAALPARLERRSREDQNDGGEREALDAMRGAPATPAAALFELLVGGQDVEAAQLGASASLVDALLSHALVELVGRDRPRLRARVAIAPLSRGYVVCDRLDATLERELVCWPDDSSHHLAAAIPPGRRADWLDLGCGSAIAPIARPELAERIAGIDINPRAVRYAQLGAALSSIAHFTAACGAVGDPVAPAELVTCNAPIPDDDLPAISGPEVWRRADPGFFDQLWRALPRAVRPGGLIVVHAADDALIPALRDAPGERVVVRYTPEGAPGFAIAWWKPDRPDRFVAARRALTPDRPHLESRDRDDALSDSLPRG